MKLSEEYTQESPVAQEPSEDWILSLMPGDTPLYMLPAWIGAISFAFGEPGCIEAFRRDTGNKWHPGEAPLDRMIDEACGADKKFIENFIKWANVAVWGPIDGEPELERGE